MRNGSGTYVLPAGQPVVTGTTVSSTTHNTLMTDIANALTTSVASDGQTAMTGNLPMGGNKVTGLGTGTLASDAVRYDQVTLKTDLAASGGSSLVGFMPTGIGAVETTVQAALDKLNQKQTGFFYADLGAKVNRVADRLFVGDAVVHDGNQSPTTGTWVKSVSSGIYEYLERAGTLVAPAYKAGVGIFGPARSSTGAGGAGDASIGVAGFAYNDYPAGAASAWALYGTALRAAGVGGATHGIEVDIANAGATVQLYPAAMFLPGQTHGAWIATGGESTATAGLVKTASLAVGIISNDPAFLARFDKGIVFHNKALAGTDGVTGNGVAIAFAARHQQLWFNNSNQVVGEIVGNAVLGASAMRLDLSDFGLLVQDRGSGATNFQVQQVIGSANYLTALAAAAASPPSLVANGSDTDIDLLLTPKGAGVARFGAYTAGAVAQAGYVTIKDAGGTLRRLLVG